mgnify:CR=1 FL=1
MYGSTAPPPSMAAAPTYVPPSSMSSEPTFAGMATAAPMPTYVPPSNSTNTASGQVTLSGLQSVIAWNSGGVVPAAGTPEFAARANQLGYYDWEGMSGPPTSSTPGPGVTPMTRADAIKVIEGNTGQSAAGYDDAQLRSIGSVFGVGDWA